MAINSEKSVFFRVRHIAFIYYRAATHLYALGVLIFIILHFTIGERWLVVAFLDTFAHLLWLPAIIFFVLNLVFKQWRLSVMLLPPILAFLFTWGTMFLPKNEPQAASTDIPLRILTFNLNGNNSQLAAIEGLIREAHADIVALQELSAINSPAVENRLNDIYPYMALHTTPNVTQGQGILSRYPITDDSFWIYDFAGNMLGHQRVEISLEDNRSIVLYNVHPSHPGMQGSLFDPQYRSLEIEADLQRSTEEAIPQLLLGDFNMPELSDDYDKIRQHYNDAFRSVGYGMGWSFPNTRLIPPFLRLDYLFYSSEFVAQDARVWSYGAGSDHRPLLVDLILSHQ